MTPEVKKESGLAIFNSPEFGSIRVFMRDDEPWFVAADLCAVLQHSNNREAVSRLDDDEKITVSNPDGNPRAGIPLTFTLVSEAGMYELILTSRLPKAKDFKRWVKHDVLPAIRKTGSYSVSLPKTLPEALRAYADEVERREQAERTIQQYDNVLGQMVDLARQQQATIGAQADELGIGEHYKAVTGIPWLSDYFDLTDVAYQQIGRALTEWSRVLGYEKLMVKHPRFPKGVGNYHVDVIDAFRRKLDNDPMYLAKYRKIVCLPEGL